MSTPAQVKEKIPFQLRVYLLMVGTGRDEFLSSTEPWHRAFEEIRRRHPELFPEFDLPVVMSHYPYSQDLESALFFLMNAGEMYQDAPWFESYFLDPNEIKRIVPDLRGRSPQEVEALLGLGPEFAELLDRFGGK